MDYYAGIDVSLELSSVCILDGSGQIAREAKVASVPEALATFLEDIQAQRTGRLYRELAGEGCTASGEAAGPDRSSVSAHCLSRGGLGRVLYPSRASD